MRCSYDVRRTQYDQLSRATAELVIIENKSANN